MQRRSRSIQVAGLACALVLVSLALFLNHAHAARITSQEKAKMSAESKAAAGSPFFCNLSAMNADQRKHHHELTTRLRQSVKEVRELGDGYSFRFAGETTEIAAVAEWVTLERLCCPFFNFRMEVGSAGEPLWLSLTGRDGVKSFMQSEFGIK